MTENVHHVHSKTLKDLQSCWGYLSQDLFVWMGGDGNLNNRLSSLFNTVESRWVIFLLSLAEEQHSTSIEAPLVSLLPHRSRVRWPRTPSWSCPRRTAWRCCCATRTRASTSTPMGVSPKTWCCSGARCPHLSVRQSRMQTEPHFMIYDWAAGQFLLCLQHSPNLRVNTSNFCHVILNFN